MYIYRNTRTGVEITTLCPVGGEWELVEQKEDAKPVPEKKPVKKTTRKTVKK